VVVGGEHDGLDQPGRTLLPPGVLPGPASRLPVGKVTPPAHRTGRRAGWRRFLCAVVTAASALVLVTSAVAYGYYRQLDSNINRTNVFAAISGPRPSSSTGTDQNILLVGSDSRVGLTPAQLKEALTGNDGGSVSTDTIILLHVPAGAGQVTMISFPRDSWVAIPGHHMFKINSAFGDGEMDHVGGGPALLVQTVEQLAGVRVDHFIEVNLIQFLDITKAVGGVQVCLTRAAKDNFSGIDLPAGVQSISGSQALAFVRQRHGLPDGDLSRIQRQQRFASAVIRKVKSIRDPVTFNSLLQQVTNSLTVDSGESAQSLLELASRLKGIDVTSVHYVTIPTVDGEGNYHTVPGIPDQVSYITVDPAAVQRFVGNVVAGRDPNFRPPQSTDSTPSVSPAQVHVQVLNGTSAGTKAASTRTALSSYGYLVDAIGDSSPAAATTIRYSSSQAGEAKELGKAVRGATLSVDNSLGNTLVLTLGSSGAAVTNPALAPPGIPTPTASSSPAPTSSPSTGAGGVVCGP